MKINEIFHKSPFTISYTNAIHYLLKRADARKSADLIYLIYDAYR